MMGRHAIGTKRGRLGTCRICGIAWWEGRDTFSDQSSLCEDHLRRMADHVVKGHSPKQAEKLVRTEHLLKCEDQDELEEARRCHSYLSRPRSR